MGEPPELSQIEGTKIQVKIPVDQLVVDAKADHGKLLVGIGTETRCVRVADVDFLVLQRFYLVFQGAKVETVLYVFGV